MTTSLPSLIPLLPAHPALLPLLRATRPFAHGVADAEPFLVKLTSFLGSREKEEQRAAIQLVAEIVEQDVDNPATPVVPNSWGKRWVGVLLPMIEGAPVTFAQSVDTSTRQGILLGALAHEVASEEKIQPLVRALEGWTLVIHALLSFPTARPVTLPLGGIIHLALRMLTCTPAVPFAEHVEGDASFKASFNAALPRLWVAALKLISACTLATGQHVMPYLGTILDHSIYLSESISSHSPDAHAPQLALLRFHTLVLSRLQTDPSATAYHLRLAKLSLGHVTRLLQQKPLSQAETASDHTMGKKGKKRLRAAGEDAFVGSLSGRMGQGAVGREQGKVIVAALKLISILLPHPALPTSMQSLIIRLLLSLSYSLEIRSAGAISSVDLVLHERISRAVEAALSKALRLRGIGGSVGPWAGLVIDIPTSGDDFAEAITTVIHPLLPPLSRPLPPISSLAFYNVPGSADETTEERALRAELGLQTSLEATKSQDAQRVADVEEEEPKRRRVVVEIKESVTTSATSVVESPAILPLQQLTTIAPSAVTRPEPSTAPPHAAPEMAPVQNLPTAPLEAPLAQHGSLSVQAVPPPIVLPPDVTTASLHVPGMSTDVGGDAEADNDDFEMPEINLESDSDEEDEEDEV
ncbi:hypothetical protein QFC19_007790 [Naganishia cerealis]|uniref:Uncharacterized protein n=1 Tax=Naganishia cerealis TaxID=610337 RepID=A0ACC2V7N0_9TREE|nr:hypothetical protein QFC19_007790 [Naganishia cerealis]